MIPDEDLRDEGSAEGDGQGTIHVPVLLRETLDALDLRPGMVVVDGTAGAAGHGRAIALAIGSSGHYVGLDRDREILARARSVLGGLSGGRARYSFHSALYSNMSKVLAEEGLSACDRVLLDIGVSSMQIDTPERGFSLRLDGPLDMQMNRDSGVTLGQWLARVTEEELSRVIYEYGEERHSRRIAKVIVNARTRGGLHRTMELADVIRGAVSGGGGRQRIDPATRTFQALRIAINDELGELERGLEVACDSLVDGGRLVVITFHSLEDRIVKQFMRKRMELLFKKPVVPGATECRRNPRARSAKLRCGIKRVEDAA